MKNRIASVAFTLALAATALLAAPGRTHAATVGPVASGTGWKLLTPSIDHIDTRSWTVAFHDTTSRTHLTPYVKNAAAEVASYLGVKVTVTTKIVPVTIGKCPPDHVISLRYMSKPNPDRPNQSFTGTCGWKHATYSAYIFINSDYWLKTRNFTEWQRMNVIWHEMGHATGLAHPATCPRNSAGLQPLMCGDPYKDTRTKRFSSFDRTGFHRLVTNRAYYPLP